MPCLGPQAVGPHGFCLTSYGIYFSKIYTKAAPGENVMLPLGRCGGCDAASAGLARLDDPSFADLAVPAASADLLMASCLSHSGTANG